MHFDLAPLSEVARRYEDEGYRVLVEPRGDCLPAFALGLDLDLIAVKPGDSVVVEVKQNRSDLDHDRQLASLATIVNAQPGWGFDLVIIDPETPVEKLLPRSQEPSAAQLQQVLARAEQLLASDELPLACIVAWAATEAAMRALQLAREAGGRSEPAELMRTLYALGHVTPADFQLLREAFNHRTQAVHGLLTPDLDATSVLNLIGVARRMLASAGQSDLPN